MIVVIWRRIDAEICSTCESVEFLFRFRFETIKMNLLIDVEKKICSSFSELRRFSRRKSQIKSSNWVDRKSERLNLIGFWGKNRRRRKLENFSFIETWNYSGQVNKKKLRETVEILRKHFSIENETKRSNFRFEQIFRMKTVFLASKRTIKECIDQHIR